MTRNASPRNASAISKTPEPRPCRGFAISALPPSAAIVSAVRKGAWASFGKLSKSFSAALIQETGLVFLASAIHFDVVDYDNNCQALAREGRSSKARYQTFTGSNAAARPFFFFSSEGPEVSFSR